MTKVKYTSASPKAGQTEHLQPHVANILVTAGLAEALPLARRGSIEWLADMQAAHGVNSPTPTVSWGVHVTAISKRPVIVASCSNKCSVNFRYDGPIELKDKKGKVVSRPIERVVFTHSCGGVAPEKVPPHIVAEYGALINNTPVEYTADEAEMLTEGFRVGDSGKRRPIFQGDFKMSEDGKLVPVYVEPWWPLRG